jgi:hypothetical protein
MGVDDEKPFKIQNHQEEKDELDREIYVVFFNFEVYIKVV